MTTPGGGFDEGAREDEAGPPAPDGPGYQQPQWTAPWEPPADDLAPPAYPPPSYPPGHSGDYQAGYPGQYRPPIPPPPGYEGPPGYGVPAYQPGPPQLPGAPAGYGPPPYQGSYPGGYYPDYRDGYGPHAAVQPGTNALAIASLISSFTGILCCIGSIVAIVLGAIALNQIKRSRQDGYGLAVAGIIIGVATLIVSLVVMLFALHTR